MLLRRSVLALPRIVLPLAVAAPILPFLSYSSNSQTLADLLDKDGRDKNGKKLGDDKFLHDWLHANYQKYFPTMMCPCHDGECRPTKWQRDPEDRQTLQAWINGRWISVHKGTKIRDKKDIPADFPDNLRGFSAHACAYGTFPKVTITCLWILDSAGV